MRIETERLYLREMEETDCGALAAVLGDPENMRHYPHPFDEAGTREWIARNMDRYRVFGFGLWAVCLKETGEVIGDCGLTMQAIHGCIGPEIGYHIRRDLQRRGYASEAAAAVRDWAFASLPFNVLFSIMKYTNLPSRRTAEAWGCRKADEYTDEANGITEVYAVTRQEWEKGCGQENKKRPEISGRQYTRLDEVRQIIDGMIRRIDDGETKRCAYVHLYGVGLMAAALALKRGHGRTTAELAEIAGMLHDLKTYVDPAADLEEHAHACAEFAGKEVLDRLQCFSEEEKEMICRGIRNHSDKETAGHWFDEIIKDADAAQHALRNPAEDYFYMKERAQQVIRELKGL